MQLKLPATLGFLALLMVACGQPDPSATVAVPLPAQDFRPLEAPMGAACGSLDCHGQPGRNFRLYDVSGLRLSPQSVAGTGMTTDDEVKADERSFLGLEPELTAQVLAENGKSPERLTVVRKARGVQEHKGTIVWPQGSDGDLCLTSWLASSTDTAACARAATQFGAF